MYIHEYIVHLNTYTQEDLNKRTKHTCDTCGIHFDKSKNLKSHNKKHHQDTITMEQIDGNTSLVEESHSSPSETHGTEKETLTLDAICEVFERQFERQKEAFAQITQSQQDMQESYKSNARAMQESL